MEVIIKRIEDSKFNSSKICYFDDYSGQEQYFICSQVVLDFIKKPFLQIGDKVFVVKKLNKQGRAMYLIRGKIDKKQENGED